MIFQLCKDKDEKGEIWFKTRKDGKVVKGSMTQNFEEAEKYYDMLRANARKELGMSLHEEVIKEEVLRAEEIQ